MALVSVTEKIGENFHKEIEVCSVFLKLAKTFASVKQDTLIHQLKSFGLRGQAAKLIRSYQSERNQFVRIGQNVSGTLKTHIGVPQGSVLRPLSFLVYTNKLPKHLINEKNSLTLFPDHTSINSSNKWSPIEKVNIELKTITNWLIYNRKTLMWRKAASWITKERITKNPNNKKTGKKQISETTSPKYLGLIIDGLN